MSEDATAEAIEDVEVIEAEAEVTEDIEENQNNEAEQDSEPTEPSTEPEPKEDKVQKRIDEITALRRQEERGRVKEQRRAETAERELEQLRNANPEPAQVEEGKTLADFAYDEAQYSKYMGDVATQRARAEYSRQAQTTEAQARRVQFEAKEDVFAASKEDYDTVTRNPSLKITRDMVEVIETSEKGPEMLYHFGQNPEVPDKLARLSPLAMAREFGRIEERISQPKPKPSKPKPIPPPKIKGDEKVDKDWRNMTQKEFNRERRKTVNNR